MSNIKIKELLSNIQQVKFFLEAAEKSLTDIKGKEDSAIDCAGISIECAHEGFGPLLKILAECKGKSMRPWQDGVSQIEEPTVLLAGFGLVQMAVPQRMTKSAKDIAEDLSYQAHLLGEQSIEFPEYKARNDSAEKELNELATLFENDDVDEERLAEFNDLFKDDAETKGWQGYKLMLESVGFDDHFDSAEDFLDAAIVEMKSKSFA